MFFKLQLQSLYTWTSSKDQPDGIVRNLIDFILILKRFRNNCLKVRIYPGADIESYYCPVVGEFRVRLQRCEKTQ